MSFKMPSKKSMLYGAIIAGVIISLLIQIINISLTNKLKKQIGAKPAIVLQTSSSDTIQPTDIIAQDNAIYKLCECGGKIGIYDAETDILIDIIDVFVSTLPTKDRQALKAGIEVFTFTELAKIIDDFST